MFICEVLVIPDTASMWNIMLIENLPIGDLQLLPACFPHMFSKENEGVVGTLIQNLGRDFILNWICQQSQVVVG